MGSKGSKPIQTSQIYTPNPAIGGAANQAITQAQAAASSPFEMPTAPVAGLTPQQLQAFQQTGDVQGMAQPYFDEASGLARASAQPVSAAQVQNYYNPFAANVFAAQNDLFGEQMKDLTGNLTQAA